MKFELIGMLSVAGLFLGMLAASEAGRRIGVARLARDPEGLAKGGGAAEAAVFGLLGLIIAFTFSGAASKFEARRHLITAEANAIGTAYLRLDLLPGDAQPGLRELFREYLDVRATTYSNVKDLAEVDAKLTTAAALQAEIWTRGLAASQRPEAPAQATMLLLPALNEMIDITTTRVMATRNHPPLVIFLLLGGLSIIGALLIGYGSSENRRRSWLYFVVFSVVMTLAVYVIVDLEFPRLGLIRVDAADQVLVELRESWD